MSDVRSRPITPARVVVLILACLTISLMISQLLLFRFGRDQGIYATAGMEMLNGKVLYRDIWDFKTPGIYFIFAWCRTLFGPGMMAARAAEAVGLLGACAGILIFTRQHVGRHLPGIVAATLASFYYVRLEFWSTAQPEGFAGFLVIWGMVIAASVNQTTTANRAALAAGATGLLYGLTTTLKPHFAVVGAVSLVVMLFSVRASQKRFRLWTMLGSMFSLGMLVPLASVLLYLWKHGAIESTRQILGEWLPLYAAHSWKDTSLLERCFWPPFQWVYHFAGTYVPLALVVLLVLRPISTRERAGTLHVLGVVLVQLAGVSAQAKFFSYHYAGAVMLSALLGSWGMWKGCIWLGQKRRWNAEGVFACMFAAVIALHSLVEMGEPFQRRTRVRMATLLLTPPDRTAELDSVARESDFVFEHIRMISRDINESTSSTESIYVWGTDPILYYLSERHPASRYLTNQAQRAPWSRDKARAELLTELARNPPSVIVVQKKDKLTTLFGSANDSTAELEGFGDLSSLLTSKYHYYKTRGNFAAYIR